jgi:hypothetical protein
MSRSEEAPPLLGESTIELAEQQNSTISESGDKPNEESPETDQRPSSLRELETSPASDEIDRILSETGEQQDAPSSDGLVETSSVIGQDALTLSKELSRIPSHDHKQ